MRYKRMKSLVLAAAMVLTMLPYGSLRAEAAVANPAISFTTNMVGGDNTTANVITGRTITIKENIPAGYTSNKIVLRSATQDITIESRDPDGSGATSTRAGVDISPINPVDGTRTITFLDTFNPIDGTTDAGNKTKALTDVYSIRGEYKSVRSEGEAVETFGNHSSLGTVTAVNPLDIVKESKITVECVQPESAAGGAIFKIADDGAGTGIFEGYTQVFYGDNSTKSDNVTGNTQKNLYLNLRSSTNSLRIDLLLHPTQTTANPKKDPDDATEQVTYNNYIQAGTKFEITFSAPVSNAILLTVMTPQYAVQQVETEINKSDGETDKTFINLADGDSLQYITQNFQLRQRSDLYGGDFRIEWKWHPNVENATNLGVVGIGEGDNKEWQSAGVSQLEDNVEGELRALVTYYDSNNNPVPNSTAEDRRPKKTAIVRGTGKPVAVRALSEKTGLAVTNASDPTFREDVYDTAVNIPEGTTGYSKTMDAYQGGIIGYTPVPRGPYEWNLQLDMGAKNGTASYATVTVAEGSESNIVMEIDQQEYKSGAQISNPQATSGDKSIATKKNLRIVAQQLPRHADTQVVLEVRYFIPDAKGTPVESTRYKYRIILNLKDSTPSQDSSLQSLTIRSQDKEEIPFAFSPDQLVYNRDNGGVIHLPYRVESITLTPTLGDERGAANLTKSGTIVRKDTMGAVLETLTGLKNGQPSGKIPAGGILEVGELSTIEVLVPSQDPRKEFWTTYKLDVVRDPASEDNTLALLGIYYEEDSAQRNNLINFDPNVLEYNVQIPFSTKRLRVKAEKNHVGAKGPEITPELVGSSIFDPEKQWLSDLKNKFQTMADEDGALTVTFTVTSESGLANGGGVREYKVHLYRQDPSKDATLKNLQVLDNDEKTITYRPNFQASTDVYTVEIPYSTGKLKLNITPNDVNVSKIEVLRRDGELLFEAIPDRITGAIDVLPMDDEMIRDQYQGYDPIIIRVTPESENEDDVKEYTIRVRREPPSDDAVLKSLVLKDQDGVDIKTFAFHPDETSYNIRVPYETTAISFTPTANHPGATIRILQPGDILDEMVPYMVQSGATSKNLKLATPGTPKEFQVIMTAEDGETTITYSITVTRELPSSDSRLKSLKMGNVEEFSPVFVSSKTEYTGKVMKDQSTVTATPTANHPGATIRVDGNVVASGSTSDPIDVIEIYQKVVIEVTAQDGITKTTYVVNLTNENLIEKTNNADLKRLDVSTGQMTPEFQAAVTEYEVAVKENAYSIDVIPKPSDPLATMKVFSGTREIGDYNGNYAQALVDGANEITIEVTSPDETVVKNYTVTIYRNEEDKLKNLTPLEAEQVNYEDSSDVILVRIEEYPRVGASVFNELREYPEKTIIFQGNDYSLEFKASDIDRVIPQTEIYDFRMSFTSPDEERIFDLIDSNSRNRDLGNRVVLAYFDYHGSLPGPATFYLNLGNKYGDETIYWHHYNLERDRIDYYGALQSSSKGAVAMTLEHFSTYIFTTKHRIAGSEDHSGRIDEYGTVSDASEILTVGGKTPPYTGIREGDD